jgi:hypothetical protein
VLLFQKHNVSELSSFSFLSFVLQFTLKATCTFACSYRTVLLLVRTFNCYSLLLLPGPFGAAKIYIKNKDKRIRPSSSLPALSHRNHGEDDEGDEGHGIDKANRRADLNSRGAMEALPNRGHPQGAHGAAHRGETASWGQQVPAHARRHAARRGADGGGEVSELEDV